jgi:hypothetical protein
VQSLHRRILRQGSRTVGPTHAKVAQFGVAIHGRAYEPSRMLIGMDVMLGHVSDCAI